MPKFFPNLTPENIKHYDPKPYPFSIPESSIPKIQTHEYNNATFHYMIWPSATKPTTNQPPRARIIFVHGFGEYTQIYYRLMHDLSQQGIECCFFDQRGAGHTSPYKKKGFTTSKYQFDDLTHFIKFFKHNTASSPSTPSTTSENTSTKTYLFGHSMGGGIVLNYGFLPEHEYVDGIICTGPLLRLHKETYPGYILTQAMKVLARATPNFLVDGDLNVHGITDDEEVAEWLTNDYPWSTPCVGSVKLMYDMQYLGNRLMDSSPTDPKSFITRENIKLYPQKLLILHGDQDTINDSDASEYFINTLLPKFDLENRISKKFVSIPGGRHSLAICTKNDVYKDTLAHILSFV